MTVLSIGAAVAQNLSTYINTNIPATGLNLTLNSVTFFDSATVSNINGSGRTWKRQAQSVKRNGNSFAVRSSSSVSHSGEFQRNGRTSRIGWWSMEPEEANELVRQGRSQSSLFESYKSELGRVADGIPNRVDRLAALGDGQVPSVVILAWETLA
jgi:hypothetical protein